MRQVVAVDWDSTLYDIPNDQLMPGAAEAIERLRYRGYAILIHSCNNPRWIRQQCERFKLYVDYVWGEEGMETGKPVVAVFVDDRSYHFKGDWEAEVDEIIRRVEDRPVMDYRGPVWRGNPKREI